MYLGALHWRGVDVERATDDHRTPPHAFSVREESEA
jgi:hypothetical protein